MSLDTIGSSQYLRTPVSGPSAAALNAALISSAVVSVFQHGVQVGDRPGGHGHAERRAVEATLHGLHHQAGGAGRTGGRRGDVDGGTTGTAQVAVRTVDELLVAGVGVDRGHQTLLDAERVVEHLHHRHEAVGGARGVRDHLVGRRVRSRCGSRRRRTWRRRRGRGGHDHERSTRVEVGGGLVTIGEEPGGLDDQVDAEIAPGQVLRVTLRQDFQFVAVDRDAGVGGRDLVRRTPSPSRT